jgi:hypothetical protein
LEDLGTLSVLEPAQYSQNRRERKCINVSQGVGHLFTGAILDLTFTE